MKKATFKEALQDLKEAVASKHGNIPAKELIVKTRLAEEIGRTHLSEHYQEIYDHCFPYGAPMNIELLTELAEGGMIRRRPLTQRYWVNQLGNDLGL
ncbi:hypothetical protein JFT60_28030 [Pseudomonas sp. MF6772]|uniref:hypothetical protein n=1 Tax=Pseudomonas sp. MF6772 TaxID=2797533 RepID=UPI0018E86504|nr:hypothetical protein [Pseudomonas sp. MF6772]MBJ2271230.1 hypothetical protein [Pseudomonas sp. MF6772]